jgi:hypothetical protein
MHKEKAVVVPDEAARAIDLTEDFGFIGTAIAIEIAQANDAAPFWIAA